MPSYAASNLSGFDHHAVEPCFVARPESADELGDLCRTSAHDFIPRGAGRGLADGALNRDGGVVLLERLDRLLSFDAETGVLECEGGCSLGKVIETFLRRGWFPIVTPGPAT